MAIGVPVAFSLIICGIALMAWLGIYDSQIVAQKILDGADNFVLLAIPFFLLAGELMNAGGLSKRIVEFRAGADRPPPRRPRLRRDRRGDHHGVAVGLGGGRHRRAGGDPDPDDARGRLQHPALGGADRRRRHRRAGDPAVDRLRRLRRRRQRLDHHGCSSPASFPGVLLGLSLFIAWWWVSRKEVLTHAAASAAGRIGCTRCATAPSRWRCRCSCCGSIRFGWATPTEAAVVAVVYAAFVGMFVYKELKPSRALRRRARRGQDDRRRHVPGRRLRHLVVADHRRPTSPASSAACSSR